MRTAYDYNLPAMLGDLAASLPDWWLALPLLLLLFAPGRLVAGDRRRHRHKT